MTEPRKVLPGATYLVTRRCAGRRFFLRPDEITGHIVVYCLARAAERTGVAVHAVCVMSNHVHLVVTDVEGRLPDFAQRFFREVACCIKFSRGIRENVWAAGKYSAVELVSERAVLDKMAYVIANPVTAGLVSAVGQWPGVVSRPHALHGRTRLAARRPDWFRHRMPERAELALQPPPMLAAWSSKRLVEALRFEIAARQDAAARALRARGAEPLGPTVVRATDPFDAPKTEPGEASLVPLVAAASTALLDAAIGALRQWRAAYRAALRSWRAGNREIVFPLGTWWMARFAGIRAAPS